VIFLILKTAVITPDDHRIPGTGNNLVRTGELLWSTPIDRRAAARRRQSPTSLPSLSAGWRAPACRLRLVVLGRRRAVSDCLSGDPGAPAPGGPDVPGAGQPDLEEIAEAVLNRFLMKDRSALQGLTKWSSAEVR
jgi:hypothetical protein